MTNSTTTTENIDNQVITLNVTKLEHQVLTALAAEMYAEYNFSDAGLEEVQAATGLSSKVLRGVASSLIKKKFIWIDDREWEGYKNNVNMHIWYLTDLTAGLFPEWIGESDYRNDPIKPVKLLIN